MTKADDRMTKMMATADQQREEERAFRAALLAALEQHNALIERLLARDRGV
jgi:hypothetical protein